MTWLKDATLSVKCNLRIYKDNVGFPGSCGGSGRSLNARSESTVDTEVSVNLTLTSKTSGTERVRKENLI